MRILLVILLLPAVLSAQTIVPIAIPAKADWIGTMEYRDSGGTKIAGIIATLTFTSDGRFTGTWVSRSKASSGTIDGTITKSKATGTFVIYAGAQQTNASGKTEWTVPERCQGKADIEGAMRATGILELTARRIAADTPHTRAKGIACEDLTRVRWLLQPLAP